MTSLAGWLPTRSMKPSVGDAQNGTAPARSMEKDRSGMGSLDDRFGGGVESGKKPADFLPGFAAPRKATPVGADHANQAVAGVDRRQVIGGLGSAARLSDAVHQQRF